MSLEEMIGQVVLNPEEVAAKAAAAEARNKQTVRQVQELKELYAKIASETDEGELEALEEEAAELAEELEIQFVYERADGTKRTYYPAAHWEPSSCEWEQSAQEGYNYGWNVY